MNEFESKAIEEASRAVGTAIGMMYRIAVEAAVAEGMDEEQAKQIIGPLVAVQFLKAFVHPGAGLDPEGLFLDYLMRKPPDGEE